MIKLKTLELFGGIGAPRSALENLKVFDIKAIDYVEILSNAVKAYNTMYDLSYKPQDILEWDLNVDLLIHGSPCQDWSGAGLNDVNTGRSILYQRTLDIIENELKPRPKYVVWENVKGIINNKHYKHFNYYIEKMDNLGYNSYVNILEAKEFGIPQTRPRMFCVSIRKDLKQTFDFDTLERKPLRPLKEFLNLSLKDFNDISTIFDKYTNFYTIPRKTDGKLINGNYNRVWNIDKYCGTIPASVKLKIGFENNNKLYYRELTALEMWLLQGYTETQFNNVKKVGISDTDMCHLAGNSICVPVLEAIFKELLIDKKSSSNKYLTLPEYSLFEDKIEKYEDICK